MKVKNLELGLTVQVKTSGHKGFYNSSAGEFGTIVGIGDGTLYDVQIEYSDGSKEWGNHKGIKKADKSVPTLDFFKVGDRVKILHRGDRLSFHESNEGRIGTVVKLDPSCKFLNIRVEFDDGDTDWSNHKDAQVVTEPTTKPTIEVGSRVRLVEDYHLGFKAGDVGTVKRLDTDGTYAVHFDVARHGWGSHYGIPSGHGLWLIPERLEVITY